MRRRSQARVGSRLGVARAATAAVVAIALVGPQSCYWWRYHDLVLTHVHLMTRMATDAAEQLSAGPRPLQPSDIERLRYPLLRARHFIDVSRASRGELRSFRELEAFADAYAELVDYLDRVRVADPGPRELREVRRRAAGLDARRDAIESAVSDEIA